VSRVVLDDHLLRDVLASDLGPHLSALATANELATTNLYYLRLCKSVVTSRGGSLTGHWTDDRRIELGRRLLELSESIVIVPIRLIGYRMAELSGTHRVSTLGAEAVAAAEHLGASLCVWEGDDGPGIRHAAEALGIDYQAIPQ
jgi:hypothetical protein